MQVDNTQAKSFAEGTCVQSKLRGTFNIRDGWVQELRDANTLIVEKASTDNNPADLMTRTHPTARFKQLQLVDMIGSKCANGMVQDTEMKAMAAIGSECSLML